MRRNFLVLAFLVLAAPGHAATITVTNTNPSGAGSLAQAITTANATPALDEIHFGIAGEGAVTITGTLHLRREFVHDGEHVGRVAGAEARGRTTGAGELYALRLTCW